MEAVSLPLVRRAADAAVREWSEEQQRQFDRKFTYTARNDAERAVLESAVHPFRGEALDNFRSILLGKWAIAQLEREEATPPRTKCLDSLRAVRTAVAQFCFSSQKPFDLYSLQRVVSDAVALRGEFLSEILGALVRRLRSPMTDAARDLAARQGLELSSGVKVASKEDLRKRCHEVLYSEKPDTVLSGENLNLISALVKTRIKSEVSETSEKINPMMRICIGLTSSGNRSFFIPNTDGDPLPFDFWDAVEQIPETVDFAIERVCLSIRRFVRPFPQATSELLELLNDGWPPVHASLSEQLSYMKGCLWLAREFSVVQQPILSGLLIHLAKLDADADFHPPAVSEIECFARWVEEAATSSTESHLAEPEKSLDAQKNGVLSLDVIAESYWTHNLVAATTRGQAPELPASNSGVATILDSMLAYLFWWTNQQLCRWLVEPVPKDAAASVLQSTTTEDSEGVSEASESSFSSDTEESTDARTNRRRSKKTGYCLKAGGIAANYTVAQVFVSNVLAVFKTLILRSSCSTTRCVQFYLFYLAGQDLRWSERFLQMVFKGFFESKLPLPSRRNLISFAADYLCRAKYLPLKMVRSALAYLLDFLWDLFETKQGPAADDQGGTRGGSRSPSSSVVGALFCDVMAAIFRVLCFHGDVLSSNGTPAVNGAAGAASDSNLDWLIAGPRGLEAVLVATAAAPKGSTLDHSSSPLAKLPAGLLAEFAAVCRRLEILKSTFLLQTGRFSKAQSRGVASPSRDPGIVSTRKHASGRIEGSSSFYIHYPFEPVPIRYSSRWTDPLYLAWPEVLKRRVVAQRQRDHAAHTRSESVTPDVVERSSSVVCEHDPDSPGADPPGADPPGADPPGADPPGVDPPGTELAAEATTDDTAHGPTSAQGATVTRVPRTRRTQNNREFSDSEPASLVVACFPSDSGTTDWDCSTSSKRRRGGSNAGAESNTAGKSPGGNDYYSPLTEETAIPDSGKGRERRRLMEPLESDREKLDAATEEEHDDLMQQMLAAETQIPDATSTSLSCDQTGEVWTSGLLLVQNSNSSSQDCGATSASGRPAGSCDEQHQSRGESRLSQCRVVSLGSADWTTVMHCDRRILSVSPVIRLAEINLEVVADEPVEKPSDSKDYDGATGAPKTTSCLQQNGSLESRSSQPHSTPEMAQEPASPATGLPIFNYSSSSLSQVLAAYSCSSSSSPIHQTDYLGAPKGTHDACGDMTQLNTDGLRRLGTKLCGPARLIATRAESSASASSSASVSPWEEASAAEIDYLSERDDDYNDDKDPPPYRSSSSSSSVRHHALSRGQLLNPTRHPCEVVAYYGGEAYDQVMTWSDTESGSENVLLMQQQRQRRQRRRDYSGEDNESLDSGSDQGVPIAGVRHKVTAARRSAALRATAIGRGSRCKPVVLPCQGDYYGEFATFSLKSDDKSNIARPTSDCVGSGEVSNRIPFLSLLLSSDAYKASLRRRRWPGDEADDEMIPPSRNHVSCHSGVRFKRHRHRTSRETARP